MAAPLIWERLGNPINFVEPFFGSGAVLLNRPHVPKIETVNDRDCHLVNCWRAMQHNPEQLASLVDEPVNEITQHAYHLWLVEPTQRAAFEARLIGDPEFYDLQRAARWLYGLCTWIGGEWCGGKGSWTVVDGKMVKTQHTTTGSGIKKQRIHLGAGRGIHRQCIHLGDAGQEEATEGLLAWFRALQARLKRVRVCCGDWQRVLGPSVTYKHGLTGIVLDPPYAASEDRDKHIYTVEDTEVAHAVRAWCLDNGQHPLLRIVLCGYDTTHDELLNHGWTKQPWKAHDGYGNQGNGRGRANAQREMLWCSPACIPPGQLTLFGGTL